MTSNGLIVQPGKFHLGIRKSLSRIKPAGQHSSCWERRNGSQQHQGPQHAPPAKTLLLLQPGRLEAHKTPILHPLMSSRERGKEEGAVSILHPCPAGSTTAPWGQRTAEAICKPGLRWQVVLCSSQFPQLEGLNSTGTSRFLHRWLTQRAFQLLRGRKIPQPLFLCQVYCLFLTASCH